MEYDQVINLIVHARSDGPTALRFSHPPLSEPLFHQSDDEDARGRAVAALPVRLEPESGEPKPESKPEAQPFAQWNLFRFRRRRAANEESAVDEENLG
eukprot:COSAG02_NODE_35661_length_465_cov_0.909836_1_plen_97_part_10